MTKTSKKSQIPHDEKIKGSMVDEEFYREFSAGRSELEKRVDEAWSFGGGNGIDINILHDETFEWVKQWRLDIEVYTYGQPRIGNLMFSHYVNTKLPGKIFRMTNYNDFVPKYPKLHFGNEFLHHARAIERHVIVQVVEVNHGQIYMNVQNL
ncbi:hypothetical protein G9A89_007536 [Geosiphon pyriformis]|nr:hypothetical protein G9A89_007536 [Geosiphon pyriformis]